MTGSEHLWTPELVELVANAITDNGAGRWPETTAEAVRVLAALAEAGRLLPAGTYTEEEYQFGTEARTVWVGPWRPVPDIEDET